MPCCAKPVSSVTRLRLCGMCSTFQPMSNSARRALFRAASSFLRASASSCRPCSMSWARHSPCARAATLSLLPHSKLPRGRRQRQQRTRPSPSASTTSSKSFCATWRSCHILVSSAVRVVCATGENLARSSSAEASGKAPAPALPRSLGWNQRRCTPSTGFTPTTMSSPPQRSRTTWPCVKPPMRRQTSSRMSKSAKGAFLSRLPT
mmetsp:Transcript_51290/g.164223  ORF Transcript_51290/g.164223 Transcript_51290/m.164223 type:complete len:206 (+) Transcript_51290:257-874(+)